MRPTIEHVKAMPQSHESRRVPMARGGAISLLRSRRMGVKTQSVNPASRSVMRQPSRPEAKRCVSSCSRCDAPSIGSRCVSHASR